MSAWLLAGLAPWAMTVGPSLLDCKGSYHVPCQVCIFVHKKGKSC